jgi:hypothetical protein
MSAIGGKADMAQTRPGRLTSGLTCAVLLQEQRFRSLVRLPFEGVIDIRDFAYSPSTTRMSRSTFPVPSTLSASW